MNVVIIGGKNRERLGQALLEAFDSFNVFTYEDTNEFLSAISTRSIDVHRVLLFESGIMNLENEDDGFEFVESLQTYYPAAKLISVCQNRENAEYLSQIIVGSNYLHFVPTSAKVKMMTDFAQQDLAVLKKRYKEFLYVAETKAIEEVIVETKPEDEQIVDIPGQVQKIDSGKPEKRSILDRVFGRHPKNNNTTPIIKDELKAIGQAQGIGNFEEPNEEDNIFAEVQPTKTEKDTNNDTEDIPFSFFTGEGGGSIQDENTEEDDKEAIHAIIDGVNNQGEEFATFEQKATFEPEEPTVYVEPNNEIVENTEPIHLSFGLEKTSENEEKPETVEPVETEVPVVEETTVYPTFVEPEDVPVDNMFELDEDPEPIIDNSKYKEGLSNLHNIIDNADVKVKKDIEVKPTFQKMDLDVAETVDVTDIIGDNLDTLMQDYKDKTTEVRTVIQEVEVEVEKIIEKEVKVIEHVYVPVGSQTFKDRNGIRFLIVTGDRRSGVTKLALNLAAAYGGSGSENVLYVDFDVWRKGSLSYFGVEKVYSNPQEVLEGLSRFKSVESFNSNIVFRYDKGNFDALISDFDTDVSDEQIVNVQKTLMLQRNYSTVIIDCPIENLWLLEDIVAVGNILICSEDDKVGYQNLLTMLDTFTNNSKHKVNVFTKGHIVVSRKGDIDKYCRCRDAAASWLNYEKQECNWPALPILGSVKNIAGLIQKMEV